MSTASIHRLIGALAVSIVALVSLGRVAAQDDCPPRVPAPRGFPTQGLTVTVHPGIPRDCVVFLPGGAVLRASGLTAPQVGRPIPQGRAIFRISGNGPDNPGGLKIMVTALQGNTPLAPELLPELHADVVVQLPARTVLVRLAPPVAASCRPRRHIIVWSGSTNV
jgi:hypothetical protein